MKELFAKCIPFDKNVKGRIGGNPPKSTEAQIPDGYRFYATLVHPEKENAMLSVFIHEDFNTLLDNKRYPSVAVKVVEHEFSEAGNNADKCLSDLHVCSISEYTAQKGDYVFVQIGGEPFFIQNEEFYWKELEKDGYSFYLVIDEEGYSDDLVSGSYPLFFGALYLYRHNVTGEIIAGFWQCS
jgi:hypothetical protein